MGPRCGVTKAWVFPAPNHLTMKVATSPNDHNEWTETDFTRVRKTALTASRSVPEPGRSRVLK